ncbi:hypothetical protein [Burkholderia gladioli]|uniref:hypothetical protein n=1 Tax=Burkholderia gladioli TaxID=28095 RepID=UPI001641B888|nr:hypothetical protein [Burkholderia gladioli]
MGTFEISAYEGIPGDSRHRRLYLVVGYVLGRLGASHANGLDDGVERVYDHKGTLEVHWKTAEAAFRFGQLFIDAWNDIAGEPLVDFYLPNCDVISIMR